SRNCERNFNSFVKRCSRLKREGHAGSAAGHARLLQDEQIAMIGIGDHSSRVTPLPARLRDAFDCWSARWADASALSLGISIARNKVLAIKRDRKRVRTQCRLLRQ